ncbi:MAG: putative secreted glycosyl hydrolase [Labilithrix sp.]|nr:putative secreted glycosyl hydrolase [Labilithrix sp.]
MSHHFAVRSLALLTLLAVAGCAATPDGAGPDEEENVGEISEALSNVCPPTSNVTGVDVASYQHPGGKAIDWKKVATNRKFAYVKSTQGTAYANPYYPNDMANGRSAGLVMGSYAVIGPKSKTGKTGAEQAAYFLAHSSIKPGDLPPLLDVEPFAEYGSVLPESSTVLSWLTAVEKAIGRKPTVYIRPDLVVQLGTPAYLGAYALNIPNYSNCPGYPNAYPVKNLRFWQYTDNATVPGITAAVDGIRFYGDLAALKAFAGNAAPADAGPADDGIEAVSPPPTFVGAGGPDNTPGSSAPSNGGAPLEDAGSDADGCAMTGGRTGSGVSGLLLALAAVVVARSRRRSA